MVDDARVADGRIRELPLDVADEEGTAVELVRNREKRFDAPSVLGLAELDGVAAA